ncbi:MAG TPA: hypothetical protein PLN21_17640 [Gemmatales bacterium]|nr:hypothetical protein [Gemmatales bacterium]
MWKKRLAVVGFLLLPILVLFVHLTSSSSSNGDFVLSFPLFWVFCLVGGFLGFGIGAFIDTPAVPTKPDDEPEDDKE